VIGDGVAEIELSHELGLLLPAAIACERLAAALLLHAAQIRATAGAPRRLAYVFGHPASGCHADCGSPRRWRALSGRQSRPADRARSLVDNALGTRTAALSAVSRA